MKFKIQCQTEAEINDHDLPPLTVLFGEDPSTAPGYDFHLSEDQFEAFDSYLDQPDYGHEWEVVCPKCGTFTAIQKADPTICPKCGETDIDTKRSNQ